MLTNFLSKFIEGHFLKKCLKSKTELLCENVINGAYACTQSESTLSLSSSTETVSFHRWPPIQACTLCIPRQNKIRFTLTRAHITSNSRMHLHSGPVSHAFVSICFPGCCQAKHQSPCLPRCNQGYLKGRLIPNWCYPWLNRAEEKQLVWEIRRF